MSTAYVISPAKKMVTAEPFAEFPLTTPDLIAKSLRLVETLRGLDFATCQKVWACSEALAQTNFDRLQTMDIAGDTRALSPAILAYEGIQFQSMAPAVLDESALQWVHEHVRILSGLYGVVRPCDGVDAYRLEMQAKLAVDGYKNLYEFWGDDLAHTLLKQGFTTVVNLASVEYAKAVIPAFQRLVSASDDAPKVYTCLFGQEKGGVLKQRSTEAKTARGAFVRWCAEHDANDPHAWVHFDLLDYQYVAALSTDDTLVFTH